MSQSQHIKRYAALAVALAMVAAAAPRAALANHVVGTTTNGTVTRILSDKLTIDGKTYDVPAGSPLAKSLGDLKVGQKVSVQVMSTPDGKNVAFSAQRAGK